MFIVIVDVDGVIRYVDGGMPAAHTSERSQLSMWDGNLIADVS